MKDILAAFDPSFQEGLDWVRGGTILAALGVICAGIDVQLVKELAPRLKTVVPGTRPLGVATHDQARVTTPHDAIAAGADLLVIGRAVTHADDPIAAAKALADSLV